jgi:hypothetical protein
VVLKMTQTNLHLSHTLPSISSVKKKSLVHVSHFLLF